MDKDFSEHISIISKAVEKMQNDEEINHEEVTELLKSLMNNAIGMSRHFEELIDELTKDFNDKITKLETFLFRDK
jgi:predicted transcriptional regulator of viral defense system|tara:strand:- start:140 stop:364 length:225 start_codon:yes stop_codon:yes gene_type:complete